jgi:hypothetical protein
VTNGEITEDQKTAILEKAVVVKAKIETSKNLSRDEQRTKMEALSSEVQSWLKSYNLESKQYLSEFGMAGGRHDGFGTKGGKDRNQGALGLHGYGDVHLFAKDSTASVSDQFQSLRGRRLYS